MPSRSTGDRKAALESKASAVEIEEARPIFIGGMGRSGTTLLVSLLDSHPDLLVYPGELRFFREIRKRLAGTVDAGLVLEYLRKNFAIYEPGEFEFETYTHAFHSALAGTNGDERSLLLAIFKAYGIAAGQPGKGVWVEKTPGNERYHNLIRKWFPEARLIVMIRDPRAVFTSIRNNGQRRSAGLTVADFSTAWLKRHASRLDAERTLPTLAIKYEDLVLLPEPTLRRTAAFIGVEWDDSLLISTLNGRPWYGNSSYNTNVTEIHTSSLDVWKEKIAADELAEINQRLARPMTELGYEI